MKKNIVNCPIRNTEYDCVQCEFYQNEERENGKYQCIFITLVNFLAESVQMSRLSLGSTEGQRSLTEQSLLSQAIGKPTTALKTLLGLNGKKQLVIPNED